MLQDRRVYERDIVHRWEGNPLITTSDLKFKCLDMRNAGATIYRGKVLLLVTVQHLSGCQCIHLAREAKNNRFSVSKEPFLQPSSDPELSVHESMGVLDPRIIMMDGNYYIMYLTEGIHGFRLGLARTENFESVERIGIISEPDMKAGTLFPKKIKKRYARLERPIEGRGIWISYSEDLTYWGDSEFLFAPREGFWDTSRIGIGPPPIELDMGWLLIYYGAKDTSAGPLYRIGTAIVDRDNPAKLIGRCNRPILGPKELYERVGNTPNVLFSTGAHLQGDDTLVLYYGAANSCINLGSADLKRVIESCMEEKRGF
jgi:predicted GH43/DUF377 family glycosyl hydrolase